MSAPIRVLVVDDSLHVPKLVKKALQNSEFELIATALDGEEGVKAIEQNQPDIVLLDMLMPKLDGIDVLKQIRHRYPDTKFVMLSSSRVREDVVNCKNAGANGYIAKPFQLDHLLKALRNLVSSEPEAV